MRVCKHGCDIKKFTLFTRSIDGWNLENLYKHSINFFLASVDILREKSKFWKASFLQNKNWLHLQDIVYKTSQLERISLLISAITKEFCIFSWEGQFIKAKENFPPVFAYMIYNGTILNSYATVVLDL